MPYISHIRDIGRSSSIMTSISLLNLQKSVQLNPHIRTPLTSESCSGIKEKQTRGVGEVGCNLQCGIDSLD